jgi:hypothetical protein
MLFDRLRVMAGLHFSEAVVSRFEGTARWNPREPIAFLDLEVLGDRVKHMNFIDDAEGSFFQYKGLQDDEPIFKQGTECLWRKPVFCLFLCLCVEVFYVPVCVFVLFFFPCSVGIGLAF